jgi:hypothetical protein
MTSVIQNVMGLKTGLLLVAMVLVASSLATMAMVSNPEWKTIHIHVRKMVAVVQILEYDSFQNQ